MRVMVKAAFDPYSGYGRDAIDICRFLTRAGVSVQPMPTFVLPPLPRDFSYLLEQDPRGRYDVVLWFGPPFVLKPWEIPPLGSCNVGWSMWEKDRMVPSDMPRGKDNWPAAKRDNFWSEPKKGQRGIDLMLVTCPMNVESFRNIDHQIDLDVLPCGVDMRQWDFNRRNIDRPMTFGIIGMLGGRKDPFVLLNAWQELYQEVDGFDAHLRIHTLASSMPPQIGEWLPNCQITMHAMSVEQVNDWYQDIDVIVSTSRGEGNDKPCMEAMATGATAIATDWRLDPNYDGPGDGHANWLMPDATFALGGTMAYHDEKQGVRDFRADKDLLKEHILTCWRDRPRVASMGERASHWIRDAYSWDKVAVDLERRLTKAVIQKEESQTASVN